MTKTFETTKEAKDHCLTRCRELCKPDRQLCNPSRSEAKGYWRNCLKLRLSFCSYHSYAKVLGLKNAAYLSYCNKPQAPTYFCRGKDCKELPKIVVEEEQAVTFHSGARAPVIRDGKMAAAHDVSGD